MTEVKITLKEMFDEIINKKGAYSQDHLTHAENVMENASKNAIRIKTVLIRLLKDIMREGDNGESSDCAASACYWLNNLGVKTAEE